MEIKVIDGKQYVEYSEQKQINRKFITSVLFLVLLAAAIFALIFVAMVIIKNKDLIAKDPLRYGMDLHNFTSCQCVDTLGRQWESYETGFINREQVGFTFEVKDFGDG